METLRISSYTDESKFGAFNCFEYQALLWDCKNPNFTITFDSVFILMFKIIKFVTSRIEDKTSFIPLDHLQLSVLPFSPSMLSSQEFMMRFLGRLFVRFHVSVWRWKCESVWKACSVCLVLTSEEFFLLSILCLFPKA